MCRDSAACQPAIIFQRHHTHTHTQTQTHTHTDTHREPSTQLNQITNTPPLWWNSMVKLMCNMKPDTGLSRTRYSWFLLTGKIHWYELQVFMKSRMLDLVKTDPRKTRADPKCGESEQTEKQAGAWCSIQYLFISYLLPQLFISKKTENAHWTFSYCKVVSLNVVLSNHQPKRQRQYYPWQKNVPF